MTMTRLEAALRRRPVDRAPIWMMRQAGRYMAEYQEVRKRVSFLELCRSPELIAEVTLQPIRRFGFDAAIVFSDILIPVEAMGIPLDFDPGPKLSRVIREDEDISSLRSPDPAKDMPWVMDGIRAFRAERPDVPILGFAGAPFTLASYMVEGTTSKGFVETKAWMFQHPKRARRLLSKIADVVSDHLIAQIEAGAAAVQVFDSWAGVLGRDDYLDLGLPYLLQIVERVKPSGAPIILFAKGAHEVLSELSSIGADALGIDWTLPMDAAGRRTGNRVALQGNLDPCALFGPPERIEREVQRIMTEAKDLEGFVFNLGHGILPKTPPAHVEVAVEAAKRMGKRGGTEAEFAP
ncbi:MAG: uroporphyrinogen decarboxylase [Myxococcota bacterium]